MTSRRIKFHESHVSKRKIPSKDSVWHDIQQAKLDRNFDRSRDYKKTSKKLARLVRYELSHFQEEDGAIPFKHVLPEFIPDMEVRVPPYVVPWPTRIWISELSIGGKRKRFQYCVNPDHPEYIQYIRIQRQSVKGQFTTFVQTKIVNILIGNRLPIGIIGIIMNHTTKLPSH